MLYSHDGENFYRTNGGAMSQSIRPIGPSGLRFGAAGYFQNGAGELVFVMCGSSIYLNSLILPP